MWLVSAYSLAVSVSVYTLGVVRWGLHCMVSYCLHSRCGLFVFTFCVWSISVYNFTFYVWSISVYNFTLCVWSVSIYILGDEFALSSGQWNIQLDCGMCILKK